MFFTIHTFAATRSLVNTIFCEAVKVDLSIQHSPQTKEQNYERYVSNSMSLIKVLFEELHPAIDCSNDLDHQSMQAKLDQHFTLFNYEKKGTKV